MEESESAIEAGIEKWKWGKSECEELGISVGMGMDEIEIEIEIEIKIQKIRGKRRKGRKIREDGDRVCGRFEI